MVFSRREWMVKHVTSVSNVSELHNWMIPGAQVWEFCLRGDSGSMSTATERAQDGASLGRSQSRPGAGREVTVVIEPSRGWASLRLWDLWKYRELLYFLVWRDVKVRYSQTAIGVAWA